MAVDAAFLHALSDMIMSIGVVIAACIIEYATYHHGYKRGEDGEFIDNCIGETCTALNGESYDCAPCYEPSDKA